MASGQVTEVIQTGDSLAVKSNGDLKTYAVVVPSVLTQVFNDMVAAAAKGGTTLDPNIYKAEAVPDTSWISLIATFVLPLLIIGGFIFFMMRQAQGTNNQAMSFGKSRARMFLGQQDGRDVQRRGRRR